MYRGLILPCAAVLVLSIGLAQNRRERERVPSLRADVDLVLVPVTVTDHKGATVTSLDQSHFTLLQDGVPQQIVSFSQQDVPCSVGVIVDTSGSMYRKLDAAKSAVHAFLGTAEAQDEAFSMSFADRPTVHSGFTPDIMAVGNSLQSTRAGGSTALFDTLYLALGRMRSAQNPRRALLVVSDGMDNHSRYSKSELMRIAMESDVQIYTISIGVPARHKKQIQALEEHNGFVLLDDLGERTGGLHFTVEYQKEVNQAAVKIANALRNQYVIGYRPGAKDDTPGKWHKIQVKVNVPRTNVYARNGYYSR